MACIINGDNVGVREGARAFSLPKEFFFHFLGFFGLEVIGKPDGLDGGCPVNTRILAKINDTHGPFAQLLDHLVPAQSGTGIGTGGQQGVVRGRAGQGTAAEYHCFACLCQLHSPLAYILEFSVVSLDVFKN